MTRAVVIKTYGDPEIAGAIVQAIDNRVIPLDSAELAAVKAELAAVKAAKRRQDARDGVRAAGDDKRWLAIQEDMARNYAVRQPGKVRGTLLGIWALMWMDLLEIYRYMARWNRGELS